MPERRVFSIYLVSQGGPLRTPANLIRVNFVHLRESALKKYITTNKNLLCPLKRLLANKPLEVLMGHFPSWSLNLWTQSPWEVIHVPLKSSGLSPMPHPQPRL